MGLSLDSPEVDNKAPYAADPVFLVGGLTTKPT